MVLFKTTQSSLGTEGSVDTGRPTMRIIPSICQIYLLGFAQSWNLVVKSLWRSLRDDLAWFCGKSLLLSCDEVDSAKEPQ